MNLQTRSVTLFQAGGRLQTGHWLTHFETQYGNLVNYVWCCNLGQTTVCPVILVERPFSSLFPSEFRSQVGYPLSDPLEQVEEPDYCQQYWTTGVFEYPSTGGCILMLKETAERCQRAVLHQSCSNPPSHDNTTLIYMAPKLYQLCREGKLEEVRAALKRGSNVNSRGSLHTVCDDTQNLNKTKPETIFGIPNLIPS